MIINVSNILYYDDQRSTSTKQDKIKAPKTTPILQHLLLIINSNKTFVDPPGRTTNTRRRKKTIFYPDSLKNSMSRFVILI